VAARHDKNVVLANWFATIQDRTNLLWDDEVHPQPPGPTLYARMLASAVQRAARRLGHQAQGPPAAAPGSASALLPGSRPTGAPIG
jgi:hypothetical protein